MQSHSHSGSILHAPHHARFARVHQLFSGAGVNAGAIIVLRSEAGMNPSCAIPRRAPSGGQTSRRPRPPRLPATRRSPARTHLFEHRGAPLEENARGQAADAVLRREVRVLVAVHLRDDGGSAHRARTSRVSGGTVARAAAGRPSGPVSFPPGPRLGRRAP